MSSFLRFAWNWHMMGRKLGEYGYFTECVGGIHAHRALNYLLRYFFGIFFQSERKQEYFRVYRNHCIDWLLMYRCTELLKSNVAVGCGLRAAWDMSRVQATQGASSIDVRINKGRVVINSVRACCGLGGRGRCWACGGGRLTRRIINIFHTAFPAVFEFLKCEQQQQQQQLAQWTQGQSIKINPSLSRKIHVNMLHARG